MSHLRQAFDEIRCRWLGVRIGGPDATLRGQWVVLALSLALVFACFFALGRMRSGGGEGSPGAAPSALASPSGQPAVPTGLSGGSPIAGAVPVAIAVKPRPRPVQQVATSAEVPAATSSGSSTAEGAGRESSAPAQTQSASVAGETTAEPAPTKASAPPRSSGGGGSSGASPVRGGSQSSGGASFDSSE